MFERGEWVRESLQKMGLTPKRAIHKDSETLTDLVVYFIKMIFSVICGQSFFKLKAVNQRRSKEYCINIPN